MAHRTTASADPTRRSSPALIARMSAMMFLQYWPLGTWGVTVGTYIAANTGTLGTGIFSAGFAGYSTAAGAIGGLISPVLIGYLSDRFFSAERLVSVMHVGCAIAAWGMYESQTQAAFFLWLLVYFHCFWPAAALTNKIALKHLANADAEYPLVRISGTAGWIVAGLFVGFAWPTATGASIEATRVPLIIGACGSLLMAFFALALPHTAPEGRASVFLPGAIRQSGELVRNRLFIVFLVVAMLASIPSMAYNNFSNLFLNDQAYPHPAALMTLGQVSDLLFLALLPWLIARFGLRFLFASGVAAWCLRYCLLAMSSHYGIAVPVFAAILIQGPCYVLVYVVGVMYVDHLTGGTHRGAAQGLYTLASTGVGNLLGALSVGLTQQAFLVPPYNWTAFWLVPAAISGAAIVVFQVAFKPPRDAQQLRAI